MKRIIASLSLIIFALFGSSSCTVKSPPDEAISVVNACLTARKTSIVESAQYAHFESTEKRKLYIDSGDFVLDYIIESTEMINENLYEFTILIKSTSTGTAYLRVYNFAAFLDGEWWYINGIGNIPNSLKDNLDQSRFSYTNH